MLRKCKWYIFPLPYQQKVTARDMWVAEVRNVVTER